MIELETIKWMGTAILFIGTVINSFNVYPLGPIILLMGGVLWSIVGIISHDIPLIVTNVSMLLMSISILIYTIFFKRRGESNGRV